MIPRLYAPGATSFATGGLGPLPDCISCVVTEERNGIYELELQYPITGRHFSDLAEDCIIYAVPADGKPAQPFRIYKISRSLSGIAVVYAEHISYMLNSIVVSPFTATSCAGTMAALSGNAVGTCPFEFWTDKNVSGTFAVDVPKTIRSMLCGSEGSVLDVYGTGEYEFDGFTVKLYLHRGEDRGVTIKYGKNLSALTHETDATSVYTGIAPFWKGTDEGGTETIVYLPEIVVNSSHTADYAYPIIKPVDFSGAWQTPPTEAQLRTRANRYISDNEGWSLDHDITVSFVALWQTEEYKDVAALQRVYLCDTVTVVYDKLGVSTTAKVIKTTFDVLRERYTSITLGEARQTLGAALVDDAVATAASATTAQVNSVTSMMQAAIDTATELIQGGLGGHVVINTDANGHPNEILVMDTDSTETAVNVIRINLAGIGFSSQGYNGPFSTAWTLEDAAFNADYITAGTLRANLIKAGILSDAANKNYWNMETGQLSLSASATVGGNTVASTSDVSTAQTNAVNAAKDYTDGELADYSTTTEMNTAISTSASGIRTEVSQTYATKTYTDNKATTAESSAKTYADGKATTAENNAKTYADGVGSTAESNANAYTDGQLQNYSTTTQMQSAISQSASAIETSVSQTYTTKADFDALSVGGKNFITHAMVKTPGWSKNIFYYEWPDWTTSNYGTCLKGNVNELQMWSCLGLVLVPGRDYTISFVCWNEGNDQGTITCVADIARNSDNSVLGRLSFMPTSSRDKYSFTVNSNDSGMKNCTLRLYSNATHTGSIGFSDIQLEEGNTATAWHPAGEDLVTEAEAYAESRITQTATDITTTVAQSINAISTEGMNMIPHAAIAGESGYGSLSNAVFEEDLEQTVSGFGFSLNSGTSNSQIWSGKPLSLSTNTDYVFSFLAWNVGNDATQITVNCDLYPDTLPQFSFKPYSTPARFKFVFNSSLSDMSSATPRIFCSTTHTGKIYIADIKFAKGADAYAWSPFPEEYVENGKIISAINQSAESVTIRGTKISLEGTVTTNSGFKVDTNGTVTMKDAKITCGNTSSGGFVIGWDSTDETNAIATYSSDGKASSFMRLGMLDFHTSDEHGTSFNKYIEGHQSFGFLRLMSYTSGNVYQGVALGVGVPGSYWNSLFKAYSHSDGYRSFAAYCDGGLRVNGAITCSNLIVGGKGYKERQVTTKDYSDRDLYCYEMTSPIFGDLGDAVIGDDGLCYVSIDPVFMETIQGNYQVFVQAYGSKSVYVTERKPTYFVVHGEAGTEFAWEIKAKQVDTGSARLEKSVYEPLNDNASLVIEADKHIEEINKERGTV